MILVDTSVWVTYFRVGNPQLAALLDVGTVLIHPFVIGEIAVGNLRERDLVLTSLGERPRTEVATDNECWQGRD